MSIALTNRVARLETQLDALLAKGTVQGMKMQQGRTEKLVRELISRLDAVEPQLEQTRLDLDKVRAEFADEVV